MKTNAEIEDFIKSIEYCSMDEIKSFIKDVKTPCENDDMKSVLKGVEQIVIDCMVDVSKSSGWDDSAMRKLTALTEGARAVTYIEETLSWK